MKLKSYYRPLILPLLIGLAFAAFAVLDLYWFMPSGSLNVDLGQKLFVSSIFTMLTIILVNVLFIWWERRSWRYVSQEVYSMIQLELGLVFLLILGFIENGSTIRKSLTKENAISKLLMLKETKQLKLNLKEVKELLEDGISVKSFAEIKHNISNVELKYSRFLTPKLNKSIIKIQYGLDSIERLVQVKQGIIPTTNKEVETAMEKAMDEAMEKAMSIALSATFKALSSEIYNIHVEGIEFSPRLEI